MKKWIFFLFSFFTGLVFAYDLPFNSDAKGFSQNTMDKSLIEKFISIAAHNPNILQNRGFSMLLLESIEVMQDMVYNVYDVDDFDKSKDSDIKNIIEHYGEYRKKDIKKPILIKSDEAKKFFKELKGDIKEFVKKHGMEERAHKEKDGKEYYVYALEKKEKGYRDVKVLEVRIDNEKNQATGRYFFAKTNPLEYDLLQRVKKTK